jgi:hypothetical protein
MAMRPYKVQGLPFGQAFQTMFKVSVMYSVDHPAGGRSMQQDRDRGSGCPPSPPTPPCVRVRTRRFGG